MGANIGVGCGLAHAGVEDVVVATIGDSTFIHAGIPALINAVYNNARIVVVVFDNETTTTTMNLRGNCNCGAIGGFRSSRSTRRW
jgi:indolepyruvate ferredoxin oxidoreductase alpha subunit